MNVSKINILVKNHLIIVSVFSLLVKYISSTPLIFASKPVSTEIAQAIKSINQFPPFSEHPPRNFYKSELYTSVNTSIKNALSNFNINDREDHLAFSKLTEAIKQSCLKSCSFIIEKILNRFEELEIPVNDKLANRFFVTYAQSIDVSKDDFVPRSFWNAYIASHLIIQADDNLRRLPEHYRLAIYVYRKAMDLGVDKISQNIYTMHIKDRRPTSIKLSEVLMKSSATDKAEEAVKSSLERQDTPLGCQDNSYHSFYSSLLVSARSQLANHKAQTALARLCTCLRCDRDIGRPHCQIKVARPLSSHEVTDHVPLRTYHAHCMRV